MYTILNRDNTKMKHILASTTNIFHIFKRFNLTGKRAW